MEANAELNKKTILVVEDEDSLRFAMAYILRANGYEILQAANGVEGYEMAVKESPDIIISDVVMPRMNGIDLLQKIRALHQDKPLFFLASGFNQLKVEETYDMGADGIFPKPFDRNVLLTMLKERLRPDKERLLVDEGVSGSFANTITGAVAVGRGGFFFPIEKNLFAENTTVDFSVTPEGSPGLKLEGRGVVRWTRRHKEEGLALGCGIEFQKMTKQSVDDFIQYAESHPTKAFIPKGSQNSV